MTFLPEKKAAATSLGKVLILGLGKSGLASAQYCLDRLGSRLESLTVITGGVNESIEKTAQQLTEDGAHIVLGSEIEDHYDICIASPGISEFSDFYQLAKSHSDEIISEIEFAWRESEQSSHWIAITGTNGKTTTTELCAHLLKQGGKRARAVGNIGAPCISAVAEGKTDYYVAEVSSYQLASTRSFAPDCAIILNITPDHLKWHQSFENYCQAKKKIYAHLDQTSGWAILDATDDEVRSCIKEIKAIPESKRGFSYIPLGTAQGLNHSMIDACGAKNAAYLAAGLLCVEADGDRIDLIDQTELLIKGEHNVSNALAASSAALLMGVSTEDVKAGLRSFHPLEHRIEPCGEIRGIACYNDSKATNVDATLKALSAFGEKRPFVLLGGDDKGTDLTILVQTAEKHTKAVVCFGEAGQRFYEAFQSADLPVYRAKHLEDALDCALEHAQSGDIVILSPACASFDEFSCFEERGEVFKRLVALRSKQGGA